jgi:quinol-cytochrome oxidoreductase complex cytochrome b subunit
MIRVFFMGTYKAHRRSWLMGGFLLILTVLFVFTGYLLRWDEIGFWSIRVTASIIGYTPLIGGYLEKIVLGGSEITSRSLARFYMMHIGFLPLLSMIVMAYHYFYVGKRRFYLYEVAIGMITVGFLMLYSVLNPFKLAPRVGPELVTSLKPIWLFLWLYVIERCIGYISPSLNFLNILILLAVASLIAALPYIDKSRETADIKKRRTTVGILILFLFFLLSIIGYLWEPPLS